MIYSKAPQSLSLHDEINIVTSDQTTLKQPILGSANPDPNLLIDCLQIVNVTRQNEKLIPFLQSLTKPEDFKIHGIIARGGYGDVYLVTDKRGKKFALKRISKQKAHQQHTALFMVEREIMIGAINTKYLVCGHSTFHDPDSIYFLMDFIPNGDLIDLDFLSIDEIRIYGAEILLAIEELHCMGYIHRDIKPENILLDENFHVKLADYGSATKMINGKVTSNIPVGTPDYISPDILSSTGKGATYGPEVDIWSYGITLYEMFYGDPPFLSQKGLHETYTKIENIDINYPETRENEEGGRESMPDDFLDLLKNLICKAERRLSIENIKKHAFFKSIDWCNLKKYNLKRNKIIRDIEMVDFNSFKDFKGDHSIFLGFTFDPEGVKNISKFFAEKKENEDADQYAPIEYGGCHLSEEVSSLKEKLEEKERELREKVDSLVRNNIRLSEKESELERVRSELTEMQNKLERMEVLREMEEIDKKRNLELENRRAEIEKIKIDEIKNNKLAVQKVQFSDREPENAPLIGDLSQNKNNDSVIVETIDTQENNADSELIRRLKNLKLSFNNPKIRKQIYDDIKELYADVMYTLNEIKSISLRMDQRNKALAEEIFRIHRNNPELLKRELKMKKMELKEINQELESERALRLRKDDELNKLKKENERLKHTYRSVVEIFELEVLGVVGVEKFEIKSRRNYFLRVEDGLVSIIRRRNNEYPQIEDENDEEKYELSEAVEGTDDVLFSENMHNFIIEPVKASEMTMLRERKQRLLAKITIIDEITATNSISRRTPQELELEIEKEEKIYRSIQKMITLVDEDMLDKSKKQLAGCKKKLEQLRQELKRSKCRNTSCIKEGSSDCDISFIDNSGSRDNSYINSSFNENSSGRGISSRGIILPPPENFYEFNNHTFVVRKVDNEICAACNEALYGNTGLCCTDCHLLCHSACYCLVDVSCELQSALRRGMSLYVKVRNSEIMEKMMNVFKENKMWFK